MYIKKNLLSDRNIYSPEKKAIIHLVIIPFLVGLIAFLVSKESTIISMISYMIVIVIYFNVKSNRLNSDNATLEAKVITDFSLFILSAFILIALIIVT